MRWLAIIPAALAGFLCTARADEPAPAMSADDLQQLCTGEDHVSRNACRIYILGVTQGISVGIQMATASGRPRPCVPASVSAETLESTVKTKLAQDLAAHPKDRDREAAGFIGSVLAGAFPCSRSP